MKQFFAFVFLALFTGSLSMAQGKIVIATPGFDHPEAQVLKILLPEAYKQLGYEVEFMVLPPDRARSEFAKGSVDAFIFSDVGLNKDIQNAIRVPTSVGNDDIVVFSKKPNLVVNGWESLKPYTIGYQISMVIVEQNLKEGFKVSPSQSPPQAFTMLDNARTDVLVMPLGVGLMMIKMQNLSGITHSSSILTSVPLYHFLTNKNAALAPKLDAVFADMAKKGRFKTVTDTVYANFIN